MCQTNLQLNLREKFIVAAVYNILTREINIHFGSLRGYSRISRNLSWNNNKVLVTKEKDIEK